MQDSWTRLPKQVTDQIKGHITDSRLAYHNWFHVERLYTWAEHLKMPYSLSLDIAIACHDIVYDEYPNKESRSAEWMRKNVPSILFKSGVKFNEAIIDEAYQKILATEKHIPCQHNDIIILDLADLSVEFFRTFNFQNIMIESKRLYGVSDNDFYRNNIKFMRNLRNTIEDGIDEWGDHASMFRKICLGIQSTIDIAHKNLFQTL